MLGQQARRYCYRSGNNHMSETTIFHRIKKELDKCNTGACNRSICDMFSKTEIIESVPCIVSYYSTLSEEQRLWDHSLGIVDTEINFLSDWEKWERAKELSNYIIPSEVTYVIFKLLCKAGEVHVVNWLKGISNYIEIATILNNCITKTESVYDLLNYSLEHDDLICVQSMLFFKIVTDKSLYDESLCALIFKQKDKLRSAALELLCDFNLPLRYSHLQQLHEHLSKCYADVESLAVLSTKVPSKNILFAWVNLLSFSSIDISVQRESFIKTYKTWVSTEKEYSMACTLTGDLSDNEIIFINKLSEILPTDNSFQDDLVSLWRKKSETYYGWNNGHLNGNSQWFSHIGLVLFSLAIKRDMCHSDETLMITVVDYLDKFITSALAPSHYRYLLLQIFASDFHTSKALDGYMINIVAKIYNTDDLYTMGYYYLKTTNPKVEILKKLHEQIILACQFELGTPSSKKTDEILKLISTAFDANQ